MVRNFQNGKIYSIRSHQTEKIYIGSTTQSLSQRFSNHKELTCSSREIMQFADAYIELIEMFPCANKIELHRREGEVIRITDCVNKTMPGRTRAETNKQYREDNRGKILEQQKQYSKQYRRTHKNIRTCSCGVEYNDGNTYNRNQHYGSKFHVEFVNDFYERLHQLLNRYTEVE
jgi:hypothetical protein